MGGPVAGLINYVIELMRSLRTWGAKSAAKLSIFFLTAIFFADFQKKIVQESDLFFKSGRANKKMRGNLCHAFFYFVGWNALCVIRQ